MGPGSFSVRQWVPWLLLALLLAGLYGPALSYPFHYDDMHSVAETPHIRNLGGAVSLLDPTAFSADPDRAMFRPLVVLSYVINERLGGSDPAGYHLLNILLHAAMAAAVGWFAVTSRLTRQAWPAAALFALHPLNVEAAVYVSTRSESLAALGILVALTAYIYSRQPRQQRWRWASLVAMGWGLLAKATAITTVGLVGLWEMRSTRRRWMAVLPFSFLAILYLVQSKSALGHAVGEPVRPLWTQVMTQMKALVYYVSLMVTPIHLNVEHAFAESLHLDATTVLAALLAASLAIILWRSRSRRLQFACLGSLCLLGPSTLVPLNVLVNEHRLYPVLGLLIPALAGGLHLSIWRDRLSSRSAAQGTDSGGVDSSGADTPRAGGARGYFFVAALLVLAVLSSQRVEVWCSDLSLWTDAVAKGPAMYRSHMHLGGALEDLGEIAAARTSFSRAVELAPGNEQVHYNLANAQRALGDTLAALRSYEQSLRLKPDFVDAAINLAALHRETGDASMATSVLTQTIAQRSRNPELYRRRGLSYRDQSDEKAAAADFRAALKLDAAHVESHFSLANLLFDTGRAQEAVTHYQAALAVQPGHQGAAYNLADLALKSGDPAMAQRVGEAALLVGPVQGKLYYLIGQAHDQQGRATQAIANYRHFLQAWPTGPAIRQVVEQRIKLLERQR